MGEAFTPYEKGLTAFQQKLGAGHEKLETFLNYEHRLLANIREAEEYGDTPTLSADRNQVVDELNKLARETIGTSFNELSGLRRHKPTLTMSVVKLSVCVMAFFNLLVVIIVAAILRVWVTSLLPCIQPLVSATSLAIVVVMLLHLSWRYFNPAIKGAGGTVGVGAISAPLKLIASVADALHPYPPRLSDGALWLLTAGLSIFVVIVGLSPLSPFGVDEPAPVVEGFLVRGSDGSPDSYKVGDVVEISGYTQLLVEAEVSGQSEVSCRWSVARGSQIPAPGCAIVYCPPFEGDQDALSVVVISPCKSRQASAGLHFGIFRDGP